MNEPTEPLFTFVEPNGSSHIVRIIRTYLENGGYRTSRADVEDISTGARFEKLTISQLDPFLSSRDVGGSQTANRPTGPDTNA